MIKDNNEKLVELMWKDFLKVNPDNNLNKLPFFYVSVIMKRM